MSDAPHPFTLRQLQYVVAVAEELSFGRAATRCAVSQPALSTQVAQIEDLLGVRLFERDRQHVMLTAEGRELVERARRLLVTADDLVDAARRASDPLSGTLRIGVIPTIAPYLLPLITRPLKKRFPRLTIAWTEEKTPVLLEALAAGRIDGALLALVEDTAPFAHAEIASDPFVLVAPQGHPLVTRTKAATLAELRGAGLLLLDEGHCFRDQALEVCARARAEELEFRATSLTTLVQMVVQGAGVTLLPALAAPAETRRSGLIVRSFAQPSPSRSLGLVWRKTSPVGGALAELAETIRSAYPAASKD